MDLCLKWNLSCHKIIRSGLTFIEFSFPDGFNTDTEEAIG